MQSDEPFLQSSDLKSIKEGTLFYPCSGSDWRLPIQVFSPYCNQFWFVDTNYFARDSPNRVRPVLPPSSGFVLEEKLIHYPDLPPPEWKTDRKYDYQQPPILTEVYSERATNRVVQIHRHRRRGPSALRKQIDNLSVFFYRGDSEEGGSRTQWLTARTRPYNTRRRPWLIDEVLAKLVDGGLIVTDGSMCKWDSNPYKELRKLHCQRDISNRDAMAAVSDFTDSKGRLFRCIGCLGQHHHYGPSMVWKVTRDGV